MFGYASFGGSSGWCYCSFSCKSPRPTWFEHPPPPGVSVPNKTFLSSGASVQGSSASLVNNPVGNQKSSAKPNVGNQNSSTKRNVGNQKSSTKSIVRSQKSSINSKVGSQKSSQVIM